MLIRFSNAWARVLPSGNVVAHSPAASGSLVAHCEITEFAAALCASPLSREVICAALAGLSSATAVIMFGRTAVRSAASVKFCAQLIAPCGSFSAHCREIFESKLRRHSPLLFVRTKLAAPAGSLSVHWLMMGARAF